MPMHPYAHHSRIPGVYQYFVPIESPFWHVVWPLATIATKRPLASGNNPSTAKWAAIGGRPPSRSRHLS
eukprot:scaffold294_cov221-Amphora_coffeaeformis.AAC.37